MDQSIMVVLARASEGKESELVDWYVRQHLPAFLKIPGFERARLWTLEGRRPDQECPYRTLALYDMRSPDLQETMRELSSRMGGPLMPRSDALGGPNLSFLARPAADLRAQPDGSGAMRK